MSKEIRHLKHIRASYELYRDYNNDWNLTVPRIDHCGQRYGMLLVGFLPQIITKDKFDLQPRYHSNGIGASLIKHEPGLTFALMAAHEAQSFWVNAPIKVWGGQIGQSDVSWVHVPNNDEDLVAFILTHS